MFAGFTVSGASLSVLHVGERGTISRFTSTDAHVLETLENLGIKIGASIRVLRQFPEVAIETETRTIDLSYRLCRTIYVRTGIFTR